MRKIIFLLLLSLTFINVNAQVHNSVAKTNINAQTHNSVAKTIINKLDGVIIQNSSRLEDECIIHEYTVMLDNYMTVELLKSIIKSSENKSIYTDVIWTIDNDNSMIYKVFKLKKKKGSLSIGYVIEQNCLLISTVD